MHLSAILSIALSLSVAVSAVPAHVAHEGKDLGDAAGATHTRGGKARHNAGHTGKVGNPVPANDILGATYFITNKVNNTIVVSSIGTNGSLSFAREVPTGGIGQSASGGPDPLFAQDSIVQSGGMLFAVNPGDNTLSMFTINPMDPTQLTMIGTPTNTLGEFPVAVAFSQKHGTVCVLNSGGQSNLGCFAVSNQGLTPLTDTVRSLGLNQTNPPTGPAKTVSDILFNQDQSQLVVSVKGDPTATPGFVANFAVTQESCGITLSAQPVKSTPDKGVLPFSMTLVGISGDILLNTDAAFGVSVSHFDATTGAISASSSVALDNQTATCWSSFSPKTGSFFVTDVGRGIVTELSVDATGPTAKIIQTYSLQTSALIDSNVASTIVGDFLYILDPPGGAVHVLALSMPGKAKEIQTFNAKDGVADLPISVQGMAVFVK